MLVCDGAAAAVSLLRAQVTTASTSAAGTRMIEPALPLSPCKTACDDIVAPAPGPLPRPGRAHPVAAIVEQLSSERSLGRLAGSLCPRCSQMMAQALLDLVPKVLIHDRGVLAFVDLALVGDAPDIDGLDRSL